MSGGRAALTGGAPGAARDPHRGRTLRFRRASGAGLPGRGAFAVPFRPLSGARDGAVLMRGYWVHPTPTLYSLACDGPEFIYRVAKTSADTLSHRGPARARFYAMDAPRYVLSSLTSIASARPCCLLLALALLLGRLRPAGVRCTTCHSGCSCPFSSAPCGVEASSPCRCCSSRTAAAARRARETREHAGHAGHAGQAWGWQAWGQRGGPSQGAGQGAHRRPRATQIR